MAEQSMNTSVHGQSQCHAAEFSRRHPMIPRLYVMPWKQDMRNQRLLMKNAELAGIPCVSHEESLCVERRERLCHGQNRTALVESTSFNSGQSGLTAQNASHFSRYNSSVVTTLRLYQQP